MLNVLEEDYNDAITILTEYQNNKSNSDNDNTIRNTAEVLFGGATVPTSIENTIIIFPLNKKT